MNPLKVYNDAHKRITLKIIELSKHGWKVKDGFFVPPSDHEAHQWAAEWTKFTFRGNDINIPHWLFDFTF